jgi:hypothetical protein
MKNIALVTMFILKLAQIAQAQGTPPPIKLTLGGHTADVQGNVNATGQIEGNSLKARGLATGSPFIANPVYANADGYLITGYKVGYYSIPPSAFRIDYDINTNGNISIFGQDLAIYSESGMIYTTDNSHRGIIAGIQVPHKSKLTSLKATYNAATDKTITIKIMKANINDFSASTELFSHTMAVSNNYISVSETIPINLLEIDNQNFTYSIIISSSAIDVSFINLRGISIEYQDF